MVASSEITIKCKSKNRDTYIFGVYFTNLFVMAKEKTQLIRKQGVEAVFFYLNICFGSDLEFSETLA